MDIKKHFNDKKRDQYLESIISRGEHKGLTNRQKCQKLLPKTIRHLMLEIKETERDLNYIELDCVKQLISNNYYRWIGYDGIGAGTTGIKSGIATTKAIEEKKYTDDHLIGAVEIGRRLHKDLIEAFHLFGHDMEEVISRPDFAYCEETNQVIKHMVDNWLYDNLWLWLSIRVSKNEHSNQNIARNQHSIEDKLHLKHYAESIKNSIKI
jgi:hypothetical protein